MADSDKRNSNGRFNKGNEVTTGFNPAHFTYDCSQCGEETTLRTRDQIRCSHCGCRVLFKKRTKRMVQFEAR